ncbi:ribonuclease H-like domain-containing protein [Amanita rubescens]|nr:ribonuclease H-like domain-containing protein [Amanita rubescens]
MSLPQSATDAPPQPLQLPPYNWQSLNPNAQLLYIQSVKDADREITLFNTDVVGFDLEWKPVYRKGQRENPVALVQLANSHKVLLIHICKMPEFPAKLKVLLENPDVLKAGAGIQKDAEKLFRDCNVSMRGCVDLSLLARTVDNAQWKGLFKQPIGLARLVQTYKSLAMDKGRIQRSNWERQLSLAQQTYAGNDAHAGFIIYSRLAELMKAMTITPEKEYYSFDCVGGFLRKPSGAPWSPYNPNYDPGPPPPPRNKEKEKEPSTSKYTSGRAAARLL